LTFLSQLQILASLRRLTAILLLAVFAATGSGLVQFLHLEEHASHAVSAKATGSAVGNPIPPGHDEDNCLSCLTLHTQFSSGHAMPLLVCLGLAVAFLTMLSPRLTAQAIPVRIDCRGPPRR
jgi:hypothetical protein